MDILISYEELDQKYFLLEKYDFYSGFVELVFDELKKTNSKTFTIRLFCKQVINLFIIKNKSFYPDVDCYKSNLLAVCCELLDLYMQVDSVIYSSKLTGIIFWKKSNTFNISTNVETNDRQIITFGLRNLLTYAINKTI